MWASLLSCQGPQFSPSANQPLLVLLTREVWSFTVGLEIVACCTSHTV